MNNIEVMNNQPCDALGVHLDPDERTISYLFKLKGVAEDEDGNPGDALSEVKLTLKNDAEFSPIEEYAGEALQIGIEYFGGHLNLKPSDIELVTWEEFQANEEAEP